MDILNAFGGRLLDLKKLSAYDQWAISYFSDPKNMIDPNCEITIQLDITAADHFYRERLSSTPGASLTAYLTWSLLKTLKHHPCFSWRQIEGKWYEFDNLPLYLPVATGTESRYQDVMIYNASNMEWPEFSAVYRKKVDEALLGKPFEPIADGVFFLIWIIGNMRQFSFTSLHAFIARTRAGRPVFYFGKRYTSEGKLILPFYMMFDHSTAEPERLDKLIQEYRQNLITDHL